MKIDYKFWTVSILLIFVRSTDAYLTYLITPDLSSEANPLVLICNQGWTTLFWVNAFVIALTISLIYLSLIYPADHYPKEANYTFNEFISYFLYEDKTSFHKIYFFVPKNKKSILSFCGFVFSRVFISWSIFIIIHNSGLLLFTAYNSYNELWNLWLYVYTLLIPLTIYYFWKFFRIEYKKYKLQR